MELDTGATVSVISKKQKDMLFPDAIIQASGIKLKTYTGERIAVIGQMSVEVKHFQQQKSLPLVVVAEDGPALLGRNWLEHLRLDWKKIVEPRCGIDQVAGSSLESLCSKYADIFQEELGTMQGFEAQLHIKPDARPKFCRPRSVPLAIKGAIDQELDRMESSGILVKVSSSDWAAPIVPVPKKDGQFRICGDYKVSVNPVMEIEQYPLPKPQELFATLAGGRRFTKLDLMQAYLQLPLDEESR